MIENTQPEENPLLVPSTPPRFGAIRPEHVRPAVRQVLDAELARLDALSAVESPSIDWLCEIERLVERVNDVWNPVSHLNSVVSSPALRDAYNESLAWVTEFFTALGQNEALYARFLALADVVTSGPAAELVRQSLRDFRLAGVALAGDTKKAFREARLELAAKQAEFEQNVMDATDAFSHHETDAGALAGLPDAVLDRAAENAREQAVEGWLLKLDPPTYQAVMSHADSAALRELYYRAWVTRAAGGTEGEWDNNPIIEDILRLRQRQAELLGFENYASLSLAKKMAKSESAVLEFLEDLADRTRRMAEREYAELEALAGRSLDAWDVGYFSEKLKQKRFSIGDEELRAYFPLPKVLEGLFGLTETLFGIRISQREHGELWHDTARCFVLEDESRSAIGELYADFYARPNKRGGAWMDSCVNRSRLGSMRRNPIAHLVCNFAPPASGSPSYLTHEEVVTLFHEFGHCLHHLLTEIDYPSIAGINGVAWDAVELPSQFFENYAWRPEVLRLVSAHRETQEPIPDSKIQPLIATRTFLAGLSMLRQLEFSLFDFRLHVRATPATRAEVQTVLDQVRAEVAVVQPPPFNRYQCSFLHIFAGGYAAGYYSYKWAEVLAADAFAAFEEAGEFDRAISERFRKSILAVGSSRNPMESFVEFRGREPELDALLRQSGIAA